MTHIKKLLNAQDEEDIQHAIKSAELDTSGEIRVHVEEVCVGDPNDRAAEVFTMLDMKNTELHNGVLFYVALTSRKYAVLADSGITAKTPAVFWKTIYQLLMNNFREGLFADGLIEAITLTGEELKKFFPYRRNDSNELPDEISY
jgi:uncharacterized membrane protein